MKSFLTPFLLALFFPLVPAVQAAAKPIKALLIAGGCCHDYKGQTKALSEGIQKRANVQVDVYWTDDKGTNPPFPIFDDPDWAKGYDVIIHDECAAGNNDLGVMMRILAAHKTVPAVHLHCAMHSFRNGTDKWFRHLGLASRSHGPQQPIDIRFVDKEHPITKPLEDWTTTKEELYNNTDVFDAHPLAMGKQMVKGKPVQAIVAWTNEKQGARSFSTSIGHNTSTVEDGRYLDLITRGLLWSCDKLTAEYQKPFTGKNQVTFISKETHAKAELKKKLASVPQDATIVGVTAQSVQAGHPTWHAIDADKDSRWCASDDGKPQWLQIEFAKPQDLDGIHIIWESQNNAYQHKIETEREGDKKTNRTLLIDATASKTPGDSQHKLQAKGVKRLIITCTGTSQGGWASIREITLKGPEIKAIFPKLPAAEQAKLDSKDVYQKQGNVPPKIVKLTTEEEAAILKDAGVPEGFDISLFAPSAAANYPVYVASAPNGDLYVSSDGNGSLGRDPHRGRVLRLRDTDRDGRADQVTEFVKDIDSPRGLVWDHDRLYLVHPPHVSVFIDKDGDGIAEDSKKLIDGIAFGFKDRPADHTTNGLDLGIDGWLYIAGGDFGFMGATGTDGKTIQHRAGGVIRFRPDGSDLEIFSTGTRNILGTPISPLLDIFARDNTNDGGGWDVRFHHFTGLEDHGYPRKYINFNDEVIQPLADYGGGSGCGSTYLSEPGFPDAWNNAPMTCDWGTGALWKHSVERRGATFVETEKPEKFIRMTRPTDASVDGMSAVYQASWKGATFKWVGPDVGYIVRVTPKSYAPEALPEFDQLSDAELVAALESPSQVRTMAAQRTLLRRPANAAIKEALVVFANDSTKPLDARVAALYALALRAPDENLPIKKADPTLLPFLIRAMGDMNVSPTLSDGFASDDPRTRLESIIATARMRGPATPVADNLGHSDPVIAHTAFRALAMLGQHEPCFSLLDASSSTPAERLGAARALMRMHQPEAVDGIIARLQKEKRPDVRQLLLAALCRLASTEADWNGASWGTRPDTRGPYYQPVAWSESPKVIAALKAALAKAGDDEAAFLIREMDRNRIQNSEVFERILALAAKNPELIPDAIAQMAKADSVSPAGVVMLLKAADNPQTPPASLAQAITALSKLDGNDALSAMLAALVHIEAAKDSEREKAAGRKAFLGAPKLENHHLALETFATNNPDAPSVIWADAGLITLAERKKGSPESREMSLKAIDESWKSPARRIALINAAVKINSHALDERIRKAFDDSDQAVAAAAQGAAKSLKLDQKQRDKTPKVATFAPEKALAQIIKTKGDVALGEQVFTRATCVACHTTDQEQAQRGPYLGNIAQTYKRRDLAESIIDPNKSIAQGFASNVITDKDGKAVMGFVTDEAGDSVTVRDIAANEHTFKKADIAKRDTIPTSMMPPGLLNALTVYEAASLLDYLEALAKKK